MGKVDSRLKALEAMQVAFKDEEPAVNEMFLQEADDNDEQDNDEQVKDVR